MRLSASNAVLACALALAVAAGAAAAGRAGRSRHVADEHFKYGSVGIESEEGIPYWIWQVLPRMFPEKLPGPGGYGSLGMIWEPGRELPIGFSKKDVLGSTRIAVNCAFCHTATYRTAPGSPRVIVPGGATTIVDAQAFSRFLEAAAADPRFNASDMLTEIAKIGKLSFTESMNYRLLLIPGTRRALQRHKEEFAWMDARPNWGRGRIDPLNPFKYRQLRQPIDQTIGNSDMTPLWSLGLRDGRALHWDGLNPSFQEVLVSSGIGNGASVKSVDLPSLERVGAWMRQLQPPRYPFPIDQALASERRGGVRRPSVRPATVRRARAWVRSFRSRRSGPIATASTRGPRPRRRRSTHTPQVRPGNSSVQEDQRLRGHAARRRLAERSVSAQRGGADARGPPRARWTRRPVEFQARL